MIVEMVLPPNYVCIAGFFYLEYQKEWCIYVILVLKVVKYDAILLL